MAFSSLLKRPSAFLPVAMSIAALTVVLTSVTFFGVVRDADEGTAAHLWQILIAGQLPIVAFFAFRWLPRAARAAVSVLAVQVVALVAALVPVYFLHL